MKIITAITALMIVSAGFSVAAQELEIRDTVKVIDDVDKVVMTRSGDTTNIEAFTSGKTGKNKFTYKVNVSETSQNDIVEDISGIDLSFLTIGSNSNGKVMANGFHRKLKKRIIFMGNVYIGQRFNYFDKGNVKNSIEFGVRNLVGMKWSHGRCSPQFSIGVGMSGQRYSASDGFCYATEGSKLMVVPVAEGMRRNSTNFYVFTVQVPLMLTQPIGNSLKFMIGGIACFNSYAWCTTSMKQNNLNYKTVYKGLQQRLFTAEAVCSIGICSALGVYVSWSPMTLFEQQFGPQLKSWSIGATIGF